MGGTGAAILVAGWIFATLLTHHPSAAAEARVVVDSAGRRVEVPARVERVFGAGGLATVLIYTLAPDRLLGWHRPLTPEEASYLPPRYAALPSLGKLSGSGPTPDLESLRRVRPDLVLDYGALTPTYVALAEYVQRETGIPYLVIDGSLSGTPPAYRLLGDVLGVPERAGELAAAAERMLADVDRRVAQVPAARRPRVYFARGTDGLETENVESLQRLGAQSIVAGRREGHLRVSFDQVSRWDPEIIVTLDRALATAVLTDPAWQRVTAVRERRVYVAPLAPFAWLDVPPSVNRLIGLYWLGRVLLPQQFLDDLRTETRAFYALFYHRAPNADQLDALLRGLQP